MLLSQRLCFFPDHVQLETPATSFFLPPSERLESGQLVHTGGRL